jgi:MFS family permease
MSRCLPLAIKASCATSSIIVESPLLSTTKTSKNEKKGGGTMLKDYFFRLRMLSRDARLALVTSALVGFTAIGGIYTVLLNLYLLRLGYGARFIGLINGAGFLCIAVFSLPVGVISQRVGMRRMLIAGMVPAAIGFVALPLAEFSPADLRSSLFLVTYALGCLGTTIWAVNINPFLTAATHEQERSYAFSSSGMLSALGSFVGGLVASFLPVLFAGLLGSSLEEPAPYRYTLLFAGALLFAGIPLFAATRYADVGLHQRATKNREKAPLTLLVTMSLVVLLSIVGEGAANTFFNVYLDTGLAVATSQIGILSAVARLLALPAAMAMPLLAARIGKGKTILLGNVAMALCLLPLALLAHWLAVGSGFVGVVMLASFSRPAFIAFQQESVQPRWRTAMSGATTMTAGLGLAAAASGGGYLVALVGYRGLFLVGAAISFVGTLMFWAYFIAPSPRVTKVASDGSALKSPA